jgi:hypothetical protein
LALKGFLRHSQTAPARSDPQKKRPEIISNKAVKPQPIDRASATLTHAHVHVDGWHIVCVHCHTAAIEVEPVPGAQP